jgi:ATP-dependent DNA helicase RecG
MPKIDLQESETIEFKRQWTDKALEDLHGPHSSVLRNPLLAQTFYFAGLVERWGTGTIRIIELCRQQGLLEPLFQNQQGGFLVTFFKNPYTP